MTTIAPALIAPALALFGGLLLLAATRGVERRVRQPRRRRVFAPLRTVRLRGRA